MEDLSSEVPLPPAALTVGLIYNEKRHTEAGPPDAEAEYDSLDTVYAIRDALEQVGHSVKLLPADDTLPERLASARIDIAFNIAEGRGGRSREAEIPAMLEMLDIPYTGSDATTLCLALDKALCKRLLTTYRIRTPRYAAVTSPTDPRLSELRFPVIIKPDAEGSSKGIPDACVAADKAELRALLAEDLRLYGEPMLVEEYIEGREFTVGLLGNGGALRVFDPMEIVFRRETGGGRRVYSYGVKQNYKEYIDYKCPPELDGPTMRRLCETARRAFNALGCRDFGRVDFRLAQDGTLYFIEINPLPGLAPGYSDYPMLAEACGVSHGELVRSILGAALARLKEEASE